MYYNDYGGGPGYAIPPVYASRIKPSLTAERGRIVHLQFSMFLTFKDTVSLLKGRL